MMCVMTDYKSALDYSHKSLEDGRSQLRKIKKIVQKFDLVTLENREKSCDALADTDRQLLHKYIHPF